MINGPAANSLGKSTFSWSIGRPPPDLALIRAIPKRGTVYGYGRSLLSLNQEMGLSDWTNRNIKVCLEASTVFALIVNPQPLLEYSIF